MSGAEIKSSSKTQCPLFSKTKIFGFRFTNIIIVFSDFRHDNKQSVIGEQIRCIKPTW
jgi:hypothetical protein